MRQRRQKKKNLFPLHFIAIFFFFFFVLCNPTRPRHSSITAVQPPVAHKKIMLLHTQTDTRAPRTDHWKKEWFCCRRSICIQHKRNCRHFYYFFLLLFRYQFQWPYMFCGCDFINERKCSNKKNQKKKKEHQTTNTSNESVSVCWIFLRRSGRLLLVVFFFSCH